MVEYIERGKIVELSKILKDNFAPLHRKVIDAFIYNIDKNIPTADVQEVKHGYWIEKEKGYTTNFGGKGKTPYRECSICGWDYPVVTVEQHFKQYKHCPNCGAKMDKEDNKNV